MHENDRAMRNTFRLEQIVPLPVFRATGQPQTGARAKPAAERLRLRRPAGGKGIAPGDEGPVGIGAVEVQLAPREI